MLQQLNAAAVRACVVDMCDRKPAVAWAAQVEERAGVSVAKGSAGVDSLGGPTSFKVVWYVHLYLSEVGTRTNRASQLATVLPLVSRGGGSRRGACERKIRTPPYVCCHFISAVFFLVYHLCVCCLQSEALSTSTQ